MSTKRKTTAELELIVSKLRAENQLLKRGNRSNAWASIFNNLIRWGGLVLLARYGYLAIEAIAGKTTNAEIFVGILGKENFPILLSSLLGFLGMLYGYYERALRRSTVERLQQRNVFLEATIDPRRSSSKLTPRGDTRPEDRYG